MYHFAQTLSMKLSSINCGIVSLRPSALLEVILYGDKMLNLMKHQSVNTYRDYQLQ